MTANGRLYHYYPIDAVDIHLNRTAIRCAVALLDGFFLLNLRDLFACVPVYGIKWTAFVPNKECDLEMLRTIAQFFCHRLNAQYFKLLHICVHQIEFLAFNNIYASLVRGSVHTCLRSSSSSSNPDRTWFARKVLEPFFASSPTATTQCSWWSRTRTARLK